MVRSQIINITIYITFDTGNATTASIWFDNMISSASTYDQSNMNSLRNSLPEHINSDTKNNVFLEFMDMLDNNLMKYIHM